MVKAPVRNIKILDCTLRDGGYVNDNVFGEENIKDIIDALKESGTDLIEYGYLEDKKPTTDNNTEYRCFEDLFKLTNNKKGNILMLLGEKYDVEKLPVAPNDDCYLRISFHKKHAEDRIEKIKVAIKKGYKVYIQPTVTMSYTDDELVELLKICNELKPVSVAIVDTFGQMTPDDVSEKVKVFNDTLNKKIAISFHAHNNLQNGYANAIRFIESVDKDRMAIIDTSIYGIGRGAGNLPTELIMDYLNKNYGKNYVIDPLLTVTDNVISRIKEEHNWGYSLPYYLSGIYGVHPSYILTFMERRTQSSKDIKNLISMISDDKRTEFDLDYARELYNSYNNKATNDNKSKEQLAKLIAGRELLIIGPGKTLKSDQNKIRKFINDKQPFIISVNGEYDIKPNALFVSNKKRYEGLDLGEVNCTILMTSNIDDEKKDCLIFNYGDYLAKGYGVSDNALLMLLNILREIGEREVSLAGFDGYSLDNNFYRGSLELMLNENYVNRLNQVISVNLDLLKNDMKILSLTKSKYFKEEE